MRTRLIIPMVVLVGVLVGCGQEADSPAAVYVPPGDAERGRIAFMDLQCNACHTVEGIDMPAPVADPPVGVVLGGSVAQLPTKGQLVTAIIHPSHDLAVGYAVVRARADGVSRMGDYTDTITVRQLVDLVAFLRSRYQVDERLSIY